MWPGRSGIPSLVERLETVPNAIVFLAVPDDAVAGAANQLAAGGDRVPRRVAFVHLSGALGLAALNPLSGRHQVGSFHPLQSFPEVRPPAAFHGIVIAVDASAPALRRRLAALARALGARPKHVDDGQRVLYHAAAVFASNFVDAVLHEAVGLLETAGWSQAEAAKALIPLTEGALANVRKRGTVGAMTGPIRRGDVATIRRHLDALDSLDSRGSRRGPQVVGVYRMLGQIALEIAEEAGLEPAAAERVKRALTRNVAATRRRRRG